MIKIPPKKILVPVDLSDASLIGWKHAQALAKPFGARVEGLFVQHWLPAGFALLDTALSPEQTKIVLKEIGKRLGSDATVHVIAGIAAETIPAWALRKGYDLIVMGTHARSLLGRALLGSVAEAVARTSQVPVLVARSPVARVRSILAPVNERPYAYQGLLAAAKLAGAMGATLTVLHAIDAPVYGGPGGVEGVKAVMEKMVARLPRGLRHACKPKIEIGFGNPAHEIATAARAHQLVVLAAHSKGFLNDLTLGTTVERVLRHSPCPILAIPTVRAALRARTARRTASASA